MYNDNNINNEGNIINNVNQIIGINDKNNISITNNKNNAKNTPNSNNIIDIISNESNEKKNVRKGFVSNILVTLRENSEPDELKASHLRDDDGEDKDMENEILKNGLDSFNFYNYLLSSPPDGGNNNNNNDDSIQNPRTLRNSDSNIIGVTGSSSHLTRYNTSVMNYNHRERSNSFRNNNNKDSPRHTKSINYGNHESNPILSPINRSYSRNYIKGSNNNNSDIFKGEYSRIIGNREYVRNTWDYSNINHDITGHYNNGGYDNKDNGNNDNGNNNSNDNDNGNNNSNDNNDNGNNGGYVKSSREGMIKSASLTYSNELLTNNFNHKKGGKEKR